MTEVNFSRLGVNYFCSRLHLECSNYQEIKLKGKAVGRALTLCYREDDSAVICSFTGPFFLSYFVYPVLFCTLILKLIKCGLCSLFSVFKLAHSLG